MIGWCYMDNNTFYVNLDGKKVIAEVLVTFSIYDNFYCAYTVNNNDTNLNDVYSAKIVDNILMNIEDEQEKQFVDNYIYNLLNNVKGV